MLVAGCGDQPGGSSGGSADPRSAATASSAPGATAVPAGGTAHLGAAPTTRPLAQAVAFRAGNPAGKAAVPAEARAVDTTRPTRVIGNGTRASCTSTAVVAAVAAGGIITFSCGPAPVTIAMTQTAKVRNANGPKVVLDGGGKVT